MIDWGLNSHTRVYSASRAIHALLCVKALLRGSRDLRAGGIKRQGQHSLLQRISRGGVGRDRLSTGGWVVALAWLALGRNGQVLSVRHRDSRQDVLLSW